MVKALYFLENISPLSGANPLITAFLNVEFEALWFKL